MIPCKQCISKAICINQEFMPLFNSCSIFRNYILISSNRVSIKRLYEYGRSMDVTIEHTGHDVRLTYNRKQPISYDIL